MFSAFPVDNILLDRRSGANLHRQLYGELRRLIERGVLPSGSALPSTRLLARDLGLGRNTVITAYDQLALEGFLQMRRGAAARVMDLPARGAAAASLAGDEGAVSSRGRLMAGQRYHHGQPGIGAFHPGLPDDGNFPFNTWSRLLARRARAASRDLFGTYHILGYPELRQALARYLTASRGVNCSAEQIVVTNGAQSAFDVLARLLIDPGDAVWLEEPGYYGASNAFLAAGAELMPLAVGDDGWRLEPPRRPPRVIFVTPSCQHPLGITMSMEQRLKLIDLARQWRSWLIEDDYDSEYRFQGQPIPALQGIATGAASIFVGTFAKILFPAMRLGYMVIPDGLREVVTAALSVTGQFAPLITQAALADFINDGHLTRHLRRMRRLYAARRQFFLDACEDHLRASLKMRRTASGIQLVGLLAPGLDDRAIAARARAEGVNVSPLSMQYRHGEGEHGLVMGFAAADERNTLRAIRKLAAILDSSS